MSGAPNGAETLTIDVVSDVVCPWCFIGKRRLEKAIAMKPDIAVAVRWHPFFLNPWIPREGVDRKTYLETKFGSADRYDAIAQRVAAAAAAEGLTYATGKIGRQPNTLDCHRLILWAQSMGDPSAMKQRLMDLYFTEGADLTDRETLVRAARECGLDGERIRQLLDSDADVDVVEQQAQSAKEAGIEGVPCFIFGGALAVSGAQAPEYLASTIERAAAQREQAGSVAVNP
jgi:predicted DsbA family dithiol-disulfide isomerase